jgi:hypothetical protein
LGSNTQKGRGFVQLVSKETRTICKYQRKIKRLKCQYTLNLIVMSVKKDVNASSTGSQKKSRYEVSDRDLRENIRKFKKECEITSQGRRRYEKNTEREVICEDNIQKEINHKPQPHKEFVRHEVVLEEYELRHRDESLEVFQKTGKAGFVTLKGHLGLASSLVLGTSMELWEPDLLYIEEIGGSTEMNVEDCKLTAEWHWTGKDLAEVRKLHLKDVKGISAKSLEKFASAYLNGGDSV